MKKFLFKCVPSGKTVLMSFLFLFIVSLASGLFFWYEWESKTWNSPKTEFLENTNFPRRLEIYNEFTSEEKKEMMQQLSSKQRKEFRKWELAKEIGGADSRTLQKALQTEDQKKNFQLPTNSQIYSHLKKVAILNGVPEGRIGKAPKKGNSEKPWRSTEGVIVISERSAEIAKKIRENKDYAPLLENDTKARDKMKEFLAGQISKGKITEKEAIEIISVFHTISIRSARNAGLMQYQE